MPQVRLLAPASHEGKDYKTEDVITVDDETAAAWRAAGKAQLTADEKAQSGGHYSDVMGREDVAEPKEDVEDPIPPAHKKGKK